MRGLFQTPTAFVVGFAAALVVAAAPAALANHKPSHKAKAGEPRQGTKWRHCNAQVRPFVTPAEVAACTSRDGYDPENPQNEVIVFDTKSGTPQWIARLVKAQVRTLDNQLEFKYYMLNRTCGAGSPRITLLVSIDGDKDGELVLDGHVTGFTCALNQWVYEDLTNNVPRWDVRALVPGAQPVGTFPNVYLPWDAVETAVHTSFPGHSVRWAKLVEDSQSFMATNRGCAYYDLVSAGSRTITDHSDTAGRGRAPNTCPNVR